MVEKKAAGTPKSYMNAKRTQRNTKTYCHLHPEAQLLDRKLFQTLQTIANGSLPSVISQRTGQYACYTFGIIAIWRHHRLSSATCKLSAMTRMQIMVTQASGNWTSPHQRAVPSRGLPPFPVAVSRGLSCLVQA